MWQWKRATPPGSRSCTETSPKWGLLGSEQLSLKTAEERERGRVFFVAARVICRCEVIHLHPHGFVLCFDTFLIISAVLMGYTPNK